MEKITANVYTEDRFSLPADKTGRGYRGCNPSYVTTSAGIVVIDTPELPTDAVKMRDEIARKGEIRYIINTHHHVDHITGNFFLKGTVVGHDGLKEMFSKPLSSWTSLRTPAEIKELERDGHGLINHMKRIAALEDSPGLALMKNYELRPPEITFSEKMTLYVGNHSFELYSWPGHTESHIGVYIPQEKALFLGDNFTNKTQPALAQSAPREWIKSLKAAEAMDADVIVPGHGKVCRDKTELRKFRLFIEKCVAMVKDAIKQGLSAEQAASKLNFEELYTAGMAVHPGADMQRRNVLRLYKMLSK